MKEYIVHYQADGRSGSRLIKAPNPGSAEDRLIKRLMREGKKLIVIVGTQEN